MVFKLLWNPFLRIAARKLAVPVLQVFVKKQLTRQLFFGIPSSIQVPVMPVNNLCVLQDDNHFCRLRYTFGARGLQNAATDVLVVYFEKLAMERVDENHAINNQPAT